LENLPTILSFLNQQQKSLTISIEFEAIRHPWNTLKQFLQFVSYVFISKDYVKKQIRYTSALDFLQAVVNMEYPEFLSSPTLQVIICPWGKEGVYYLDLRKEIFEKKPVLVAPSKVVQVVESMGAGDTFIGAFLSSLLRGHSVDEACIFANQVAVAKCTQRGFEFSSEQIVTWTSKLK
jgi:sugar/nucleoside kinase (ribokinase family)